MRIWPTLVLAVLVSSCAGRDPGSGATIPLDQQLSHFITLQNARSVDEMRTHLAPGAIIQSPVSQRGANVDRFLSAYAASAYTTTIHSTELIFSLPERAVTRSEVTVSQPGQYSMKEQMVVDWVFKDSAWRISRIRFPGWSSFLGTWRRAGARGEGSIELRLLPGDTYLVFLKDQTSLPAFRGKYTIEGNLVTLTDFSADDPSALDRGEGRYRITRTSTGASFVKVEDANIWRSERFDGPWTASR